MNYQLSNRAPFRSRVRRSVYRTVIFCLSCALPLVSGCDQSRPRQVCAQLLAPPSEAFIESGAKNLDRPRIRLTSNTAIAVGQTVSTGDNGTAVIALVPAIVIQLGPNSSIEIEDLRMAKEDYATFFLMKSRQARIHLLRGSLVGCVLPTITQTEFIVDLPRRYVASGPATAFSVDLSDETGQVTVSEGDLKIQQSSIEAPKTVAAGLSLEWPLVSGSVLGDPATAEVSERTNERFTETCEAYRRFADLLSEASYRLPSSRISDNH
jgi:hypothetical protein